MANGESTEEIIAEREAAAAAFRHPVEELEPLPVSDREQMVALLASTLEPVFKFISKGRLGGTMDIRAWVVLRETKLGYVAGESIEDFAKRRGVTPPRVHTIVKEFRALVPGYRSPNQKPVAQREKMSAGQKARHAVRQNLPSEGGAPLPPGRKSPSGAASNEGSALR